MIDIRKPFEYSCRVEARLVLKSLRSATRSYSDCFCFLTVSCQSTLNEELLVAIVSVSDKNALVAEARETSKGLSMIATISSTPARRRSEGCSSLATGS